MPLSVPVLNPDTFVALILAAGALYGFVGGAVRLRSMILSTYVGIVLASTLETIVEPYVKALGKVQIDLILLLIPVLLFALPRHRGHGPEGSKTINVVAGLAAGAFVVVAAVHVLPPSVVSQAANNSYFVTVAQGVYPWFVVIMPLVALLPHFMHHVRRGHHG